MESCFREASGSPPGWRLEFPGASPDLALDPEMEKDAPQEARFLQLLLVLVINLHPDAAKGLEIGAPSGIGDIGIFIVATSHDRSS